jgi:NTE family protein
LRGLLEAGLISPDRSTFDVLVGGSAGSLNVGSLAARSDTFEEAVSRLEKVWGEIEPDHVFRTDIRSLAGIGARWVRDLSFGGMMRKVEAKSLLDTAPLRELLDRTIPFERIEKNVESGALRALAVVATDLYTSQGVVFVHGAPETKLWERRCWSIEPTLIGAAHLMASSAIPVFFPSVPLGGRHFGDGCIRNTAPLSPAINLGAERVLAIGVRGPSPNVAPPASLPPPPSLAQVAGVLLDAVMLDALEVDVEHSDRVNRSVIAHSSPTDGSPFREVEVLWLSPSQSFRNIAAELSERIPRIVRYLLRGLGPDEAILELASYLLFDSVFCSRLMAIGRADALASRDSVAEFLSGNGGSPRRRSQVEAAPTTSLLAALDFAAIRHRDQKRKGTDASPYINHPIEVAQVLTSVGNVTDTDVLRAAVLHDTVEDTDTSSDEIEASFGAAVRALVDEVSDDKTLPKADRKQLQIEHAPSLSANAKLIKLADKICNVRDVIHDPPTHWNLERRVDYLDWARRVVDGCRGTNPDLEAEFDRILAEDVAQLG